MSFFNQCKASFVHWRMSTITPQLVGHVRVGKNRPSKIGHTVYPSKLVCDTAGRTWGGDVCCIYIEYNDTPTTFHVFVM